MCKKHIFWSSDQCLILIRFVKSPMSQDVNLAKLMNCINICWIVCKLGDLCDKLCCWQFDEHRRMIFSCIKTCFTTVSLKIPICLPFFHQEYSRSIGDSELTFPRLLECPISRLLSYQTLLKDILRYTARAGDDCTSLEKAISMLATIELQVKHAQLLKNIEGLPGDISGLGQLIRHVRFC